ncbi:MAG: phage tail sheath family protein [Deltaproteobacteria bacterium]|nr:phage tail sheath family protein [Deltaproteobacteria bacterium]
MPIAPTYPGVYIEEIPSGVRTITGVSTSVAAFVDFFQRGFMDRAVQIFSMADFEREFGGLEARSEASYAIQQFFRNGGTEAWVVRTASGSPRAADVQILTAPGGVPALTVTAGAFHATRTNPGTWGNDLRLRIDYPAPTSNNRFNLTVMLVRERNGDRTILQSETFLGLSMNPSDARFVETVVNDDLSGSRLVHVAASGNTPPCQNGTLSGALVDPLTITAAQPRVNVAIGSGSAVTATLARAPSTIEEARALLEAAIRAAQPQNRAFSQASVTVVNNRLRVLAGPTTVSDRVVFSNAGPDLTFQTLGLGAGQNVQGLQSDNVSGAFTLPTGQVQITVGGSGPVTLTLAAMNDLAAARDELEAQIRLGATDAAVLPAETDAFALARVITRSSVGDDRLIVLAGLPGLAVSFSAAGADTTAADLGLLTPPATTLSACVSANLAVVPTIAAGAAVDVTIGGNGPHTATLGAAATLADIAASLQTAIRNANVSATFTGAVVVPYAAPGENRLVVFPGVSLDTVVFTAAPLDGTTVNQLLLTPADGAQENVQLYRLGATTGPVGAQGPCNAGDDGTPPDALALIGNRVNKTGMYALEDVDLFNLLCIPCSASLGAGPEAAVMSAAITYCEEKRAFFIMDTPPGIDTVAEIRTWLDNNATLRHKNAALYFPQVRIPDPLNGFRLRPVGASGTIAGLYARTDSNRGVWKAPAGTEADLRNVQKLDYALTDPENGALNPLGINCLRTFPIYGNVCWGARTLEGSDQQASEWKYVPVRRLALFLEESLYRGTKWVVFEPNDEPLWAQIRLNVGAFMHNLFKQGAFQGTTPREAYFVKCDKETTTQNDRNLGIVNILVGFAPLKPAEFVIIKIQQIAGQIQT